MTSRRALVAAVFLAGAIAGCDRGFSYVAQNDTDQSFVARITLTTFGDSIGSKTRAVAIPPRVRLVFELEPFGGDHVAVIEFLARDCSVVGRFTSLTELGALFVISDGP